MSISQDFMSSNKSPEPFFCFRFPTSDISITPRNAEGRAQMEQEAQAKNMSLADWARDEIVSNLILAEFESEA